MAEPQSWPAWRYGPQGEAQIFQRAVDVPKGWVDHPDKLPPAEEGALENEARESDEMEALREESERLREENALLHEESERLHERIAELEIKVEQGRAALAKREAPTQEEPKPDIAPQPPQEDDPKDAPRTARRPRKLTAEPKAVTAQDDSITLDAGRAERLKELRAAGITIGDDATDGDIEEAFDWLEKQAEG